MLIKEHVVHHSEPNFKSMGPIQFMNSYSNSIFGIINVYFHIIYLHSKNFWAVLTHFGSNMEKPIFWNTFLTQRLGLSIFDPKFG